MKFVVFALTASEPSYAEAAASRLEELGYTPEIIDGGEWLRVAVGEATEDPVKADSTVIELRASGFKHAFCLAESGE